MSNFKLLIMALGLALMPSVSGALVSDDFDQRIDRGLEVLYQGEYQDAIDSFDALIAQHPDNPTGYFFKAGAMQLRAMAYESTEWDKIQAALLDSSQELSSRAIAKDRRDAWACFIRGGTRAYRAAAEARSKNYLGALSNGLSAVSDLNKAVSIDPQLYDAYFGIGSFHYFRTKATSVLKWLPFIGDNREKGIAEIRLAIDNGRFSKVMAQNGLAWIYVDYGKYSQALELAGELEQQHPRNHTFYWISPEVHWRTRQWAKAAAAYARLLQLIDEGRPVNNYNRVYAGCRMAKCLYEAGKYREAREAARQALDLSLEPRLSQRLEYERGSAYRIMKLSDKKIRGGK